ncbi:MAG: agmatinase [Candidatus Latescibacteria bacterium]|nr:agmatinase [Candidatus Latescibacterota bacterium]
MVHYETIPQNFGGLPAERSQYETARVALLPVPYDATVSYAVGTRNGPQAILDASRNVELFDEELLTDISAVGIATLPPVIPDTGGPERMVERLHEVARSIAGDGKLLGMLGGEHTLTVGSVRAAAEHHPGLSVLQIDAHLDLRDAYEGTPYNHACAMRRLCDLVPIVPVGIRNVSEEEYAYLRATGVEPFYAHALHGHTQWIDAVVERLTDPVYITVDLDGLDPSIMPAVGTPEPGGLDWYQTIALLRQVCSRRRVVGFDVVELCPIPGLHAPDFLAARLVYKLIGYIYFGF